MRNDDQFDQARGARPHPRYRASLVRRHICQATLAPATNLTNLGSPEKSAHPLRFIVCRDRQGTLSRGSLAAVGLPISQQSELVEVS